VKYSRKQRPASAYVEVFAHQAPALLQPRLQHAWLVGSTSARHGSLMDEDQLSLGVDVLPTERKELLGSHAREKWR
jgi:hypothetical protein